MTATTDKLEANKKLARDYIDQVINQHNPGKAADFLTGDVVWHGGGLGDLAGPRQPGRPAGVVHRGAAGFVRGRAGHHRRERPGRRPARRHRHGQGKPAGTPGRRASRAGGTRWTSTGSPTARSARSGPPKQRRGDHGRDRRLQPAVGCLTDPRASSLRASQNSASGPAGWACRTARPRSHVRRLTWAA